MESQSTQNCSVVSSDNKTKLDLLSYFDSEENQPNED